jgi:transglutaminase-like putative cysteine protease
MSLRPPPSLAVILWVAVAITTATIPLITKLPFWLLIMAPVLGTWRIVLARNGRPTPPSWVRVALSLLVLALLAAAGRLGLGLDAATPLFVAFLWIKLLELGSERDLLVTTGLGFFLITSMLLADQSLPVCLMGGLSALFLVGGMVRHFAPRTVEDIPGALDTSAETGHPSGPLAIGRTALSLMAQALPLALVLFLFVPRPELQLSLSGQGGTSGLSETMNPGDIAKLAKNPAIAFRVEFPAGDMPPVEDLYWRGIVLWDNDGMTWRRVTGSLPLRQLAVLVPPGAQVVEQEITLLASGNSWLYTLETPVTPVAGTAIYPGVVHEWQDGSAGTTTYKARSALEARPRDWGSFARTYGLKPPRTPLSPAVEALAAEFRDGAKDEQEVAQRALDWFIAKDFRYTLEPGAMDPQAPLDDFLFTKRKGFCGHYAGAFAVLMRQAGVPARVVIGYHGGELNPHGGFLVVRQEHAHAWAEIWVNSLGCWERVDPTTVTPLEGAEAVSGATAVATGGATTGATALQQSRDKGPWHKRTWRSARLWWDLVEARWDRWAMGYNTDIQDDLLAWLGLDGFGGWGLVLLLLAGLAGAFTSVAGLAVLLPRLRLLWRSDPAERKWKRLCLSLRHLGIARDPAEAPFAYVQRAIEELPDQAGTLRDAVSAYARLRYGPRRDPGDLLVLSTAIARLDRAEKPGVHFSGRRWGVGKAPPGTPVSRLPKGR